MVGIVIASHGDFAEALLATAMLIVGEFPQVTTCSVLPGSSLDEIRTLLKGAIKQVDSGDGVIVFADVVGGSPCNQSLSLCGQQHLEVITGVNVPMLLKANSLRRQGLSLAVLAHDLVQYGQRSISRPSEAFHGERDAR